MLPFNIGRMKQIYQSKYRDFKRFLPYNKDGDYYFRDNKANILAVAHLDTVGTGSHFEYVKLSHKEIIFSPIHDDRLGAYLLLDYLPKIGIKYDLLLTNNEEKGASTASEFKTNKQYNWIFSFDRMDNDVVMYEYETPQYKAMLKGAGFDVGFGSYSDICDLEHLRAVGFNFGVCYYEQHTIDSWANLTHLYKQIGLFKGFYKSYKDTYLKHEEGPYGGRYSRYYSSVYDKWDRPYNPRNIHNINNGYFDKDIDNESFFCSDCGEYVDVSDLPWGVKDDLLDNALCSECLKKYFQ